MAHSTFSTWRKKGQVIAGLHPRQFGKREFFPVADVKEFAKTHHPQHADVVSAAPVAPTKPKRPHVTAPAPVRDPADVARIAELEKVVANMRSALAGLAAVKV